MGMTRRELSLEGLFGLLIFGLSAHGFGSDRDRGGADVANSVAESEIGQCRERWARYLDLLHSKILLYPPAMTTGTFWCGWIALAHLLPPAPMRRFIPLRV